MVIRPRSATAPRVQAKRITRARRLVSKDVDRSAPSLLRLPACPAKARRTITHDNGSEFARHEAVMAKIGMRAFFWNRHGPWQRGLIECANGRLRR